MSGKKKLMIPVGL